MLGIGLVMKAVRWLPWVAGAGTVAYGYSKLHGEDGKLAKGMEEIGSQVAQKGYEIATSEQTQNAIKTVTGMTATTVEKAPGVAQTVAQTVGKTGYEVAGAGLSAAGGATSWTWEGAYHLMKERLHFSDGFAKLAATGALLFGGGLVASTGKVGSVPKKLADRIFNIPGNLLDVIGDGLKGPIAMVTAVTVCLAVLWLCFPENREKLAGMFGGKSPQKGHGPAPEPSISSPSTVVAQQTTVSPAVIAANQLPANQVQGLMNGNIQGGVEATEILAQNGERQNAPKLRNAGTTIGAGTV